MRISIVTPVLNGMPWLPKAVESVARQRFDVDVDVDVEHLIRDGGSTDGSREWLTAHEDLGFRATFERDGGQTDALIAGFADATGDVFGWLNADDLLESGALRRVAEAFEANPDAVIVSGSCLLIDPNGAVLGPIPTPPLPEFDRLLRHPNNLAQPATFFRAEAYRQVGGLDRRFNLAMDVDLWFRLASIGRVVLLEDAVFARFRLHPNAKSVRSAAAACREDLRIRRRYGMPWLSPAGRSLLKHLLFLIPLWRAKGFAKRMLRRRAD
jgi:glycosyltransferase involved in cell wall biosynthesis